MLIRQMKYFVAVVKNNSFTEAAEECYISQSAISQQIQALEAELGVTLIIRENRKFTVTPAGEHFYHQSLIILDEIERLHRETIQIARRDIQAVRIGYPKSFGATELKRALAAFSEVFQDIDIKIINGTHEELYYMLRDGDADIIFNDQRRAFSELYENYQVCIANTFAEVSQQSPLSALAYVTLNDLKRIPCILISSKQQQSVEQDYYENTLGFSGRFLFAESMEEGRIMVSANRGFMPVEDVSSPDATEATIRRIPLMQRGEPVTRNYCAFWKKDTHNPYLEPLADMLKEAFGNN